MDVLTADILNSYLHAPSSYKHFIICQLEFGLKNQGKLAIIVRAIYGRKFTCRDFWNRLRICINHLGFESCLGDAVVWIHVSTSAGGMKYSNYVLMYVDNCLVISNKAEDILRKYIGQQFELKEDSIGQPSL